MGKYWEIDPEIQNKLITGKDAVAQFDELFHDSIKKRLRSDVAIGTSLSGGLDSSSVAAISHAFVSPQQTQKCFTAVFEGFDKDESAYSKQVVGQFGLVQTLVNITAKDMLQDWEKLCRHQEEPVGSAGAYAQFKVFELAKQNGVKVLLDGQGADETLAGYHKYYKWYWQELFRKRKLFGSKELKAAKALGVKESFNFKNMIAAWFPGFASVVVERQYLLKAIRHEDLSKEFVRQHSKDAYYTPPEHFTLNGVLHFNTQVHGLEELLRYADRNSMAHGREVRLPFLSHELVEFIFSLPPHFKIRQGWTKWLLRESMKNKLPSTIVWRKDKIGFEPPQKNWMEQPAMQEAIRSAKRKLVEERILKPAVLDKKIRPMAAYEADNYDWRYFSAATLFQ
jgi:asparagine synthase (glutamine-hydrolysing)